MIEYIKKDITTVTKGVILQGVNVKGAMGSGIALAIMRKWPYVYESYKENGVGEHLLGTIDFVGLDADAPLIVANAYTQINYGNDGQRYADPNAVNVCIREGVKYAELFDLQLYMPKIGCGLGGLSWEDEVKPIIEKVSLEFPNVNIYICDL